MLVATLLLAACQGGPPHAGGDAGPPTVLGAPGARALHVSLPPSVRPNGEPAPVDIPLDGPWRPSRAVDGVQTWEAAVPFRVRKFFFLSTPPGAGVRCEGRELAFEHRKVGWAQVDTWAFDARIVRVRRPLGQGPPPAGACTLRWPQATEREDALNRATFSGSDASFVHRSLQLGTRTRTGLLLPPPASASFRVIVPEGGRFQAEAVVLPPEVDAGTASDGTTLTVDVIEGDAVTVVEALRAQVGRWSPVEVDLAPWAGRDVLLRLRSDDHDPTLDYLFLADPLVTVPVPDPQRVVLIFVDTLRADHLGLYGYTRPTTPQLDAWAQGATVFEQARTVAPWTLPSARAALSGRQPESWGATPTLPELLAHEGWATGAFVGNLYLSSNFAMADGWGVHDAVNWPRAAVQVRKVLDFLEEHPHRDALVLLHLMDVHLPYTEPLRYRFRWEGPRGALGDAFTRRQVIDAAARDPSTRDHVVGRYDQSLAYVDAVVGRLVRSLPDDAVVVLFSDHGEEFWDHGDFEHGHTLYEELLHVPLLIQAPGLPPGRVDVPVSLLDITPTVLDLVGVDVDLPFDGTSLVPAARGDQAALTGLATRRQAFGRPLYGAERWGVLESDVKWTVHEGKEALFNLGHDPGETRAADGDREPFHRALGEVLGTWSGPALRIDANLLQVPETQAVVVEVRHPVGFARAWLGQDPLERAGMDLVREPDGRTVTITWAAGTGGHREVFLVPEGDPGAFDLGAVTLAVVRGAAKQEASLRATATPGQGAGRTLGALQAGKRRLKVTWMVAPEPRGLATSALDPELADALRRLGYLED